MITKLKKDPAGYLKLEEQYFSETARKGLSKNLCNYVWRCLIATSRGYGFNLAHTLGYSLVALQEMNLAYFYPIIYWNTACLLVNSGSIESDGKQTATDYKKMAKALGATIKAGIKVSLPDVNQSNFGFTPDAKNNQILFGLKGLSNVGDDVVYTIINNRPYQSVRDFVHKTNIKRQSMISLIKGGAFDALEPNRKFVMAWYIWNTCDKKKQITLSNMNGLISRDLLPKEEEYILSTRVYEFNRYLKSVCKNADNPNNYLLDERAMNFLIELGLEEICVYPNLEIKAWDKIYQSYMDVFRKWMKENQQDILTALNETIFLEDWNKYALGNLSSWEMEALCFYYHEHELINVNKRKYGLSDFHNLSEIPVVDKVFTRGDRQIPIYKLHKIYGTCIAKDKSKAIVTLLTPTGTVDIRFSREYFALFDKRISQIQPDGTKKIIEKSWFDRGNMIVVQGIRRGDTFVPKKYTSSSSPHQLYRICNIDQYGNLILQHTRQQGEEEEE